MADLPSFDQTEDIAINKTDNSSPQPAPSPGPAPQTTLPSFDQTQENDLPSFDQTKDVPPPEYNTNAGEALATTEQVAQGFLGPFATAAEAGLSKIGVPGLSPEEIEKRKERLGPLASGAAQVAGTIGSAYMGPLAWIGKGAEAALATHGLYDAAAQGFQKYGQSIFKAMAEMGYFGAAEEANKQIKGESTPQTPEDAVGNVIAAGGMSALIAPVATVGTIAATETASSSLKKIATTEMGQKAINFAKDVGAMMYKGSPEIAEGAAPIEQAGIQNTSIEGLQNRINQVGGVPTSSERQAVESAATRVGMKNPFHPVQLESLDSNQAKEAYQMAKERPDDIGKVLRDTEVLQKNELVGKTDQAIQDIAGTPNVTADKIEGGEQASKYFTDLYQTEKKDAGQLVGQAKDLDTQGYNHLDGVIGAMTNAVPGIQNMLETTNGEISVLPYKTSMGMSKQTYSAVKNAVASLEDNPTKFSSLFNIRKGLSNGLNMFTADPATQSEIRSLKASMMGYMQEMAPPNLQEGFKRYAINEEQRDVIENAFGASVGNKEYGAMSKVTPENIIKNIFGDSAAINAAKNILPEDQYNHLLGNWISQARAAATDPETNIFSSRKFATFMKTNAPRLNAAFSDNPQALQKLKDLTTMMKVVPDAPPVSPAVYDKSILEHLKGTTGRSDTAIAFLNYMKQAALKDVERQRTIRELNDVLGGNEPKDPGVVAHGIVSALSKRIGRPIADHAIPLVFKTMATNPEALSEALDHADSMWKGNNLLQKQVNAIFSGTKIGASIALDKNKDKIKKFIENGDMNQQIQNSLNGMDVTGNPQGFAHGGVVSDQQNEFPMMPSDYGKLSTVVPEQTSLLAQAKGRTATYLNGIRPIDSEPALPFDQKQEDPEKNRTYDRALTIAANPSSVLSEIQSGTIEPEHVQHLKQMYPEVYGQIANKLTQRMTVGRIKDEKMPPYHVRQAMGMFLGSPLDSTMTPNAIQAAQAVFMAQKAAAQSAPTKVKKGTSKLGQIAKQYQTGNQAAASRQLSNGKS